MVRILIVGPDDQQASRWQTALGRPVEYAASLDTADLRHGDAVLLDLLTLRVGSSDAHLDDELATSTLSEAASKNPDAFWLLISPPVVQAASLKLVRVLAKTLRGGSEATSIAVEPHAVDDELGELSMWLAELDRIAGIDIDTSATDLDDDEMRCVRRLLDDVDSAVLTPLSEGQGKARTFRVSCRVGGALAPLRVIKVGPAKTIQTEYANYMQYVRLRLGDNRHPTLDSSDFWKAGEAAALVYTFIVGQPRPLAEVMAAADSSASVAELYSRVLANWLGATTDKKQQLSAFVAEFLDDITLDDAEVLWAESAAEDDPEPPIPWLRDISSRDIEIDLPTVVAHGDIHGYNVLIDDASRPWLIDFYHTGVRSGLFDFSYAEAALLLHRPVGRNHAAECTLKELKEAEEKGNPLRPELAVIRDASRSHWGATSEGLYHLARCCAALRRLRFGTTDNPRAKWVAHFAAVAASESNPEWERATTRPPIAF